MSRLLWVATSLLALAAPTWAHAVDLGFSGNAPLPTVNGLTPRQTTSQMGVLFDCYLTTNVVCADLEKAFFAADPYIVSAGKGAEVVVEVRSWQSPPDAEQYEIKFKGAGDLPVFKLGGAPLQIRTTYSEQAKIQELTKQLVKGMAVFHQVTEYKTNPDGVFVVTYRAHDGSTSPPKNDKDSPWYVSAGAGANISSNGSKDISAYGYAAVGYDTPTWLVVVQGGGMYHYVSAHTDAGELSATALRAGGGVLVSRSVAKHWSVMTLVRESYDQVSNFQSRAQAHVGVEYELLPFLESNDNSFTVSYIIGGNYENYIEPNINERDQQAIATHALSVYYVKHTKVADFSAAAAVTSLVDQPQRFAVGAKGTAKFYITKALAVDVSASVGYKNNVINAPAHPDLSNPLFVLIGGASAVEPFTYQVNLNITYTWGNNLLRQKDTRWQFTASDLPVNF